MQVIVVTGSDQRMDQGQSLSYDEIVNPLPLFCAECGFPDLEFVPQPYSLIKSRTKTSNELALAAYGNLLVRERIKQVFEILFPNQIMYFSTVYRNTDEPTDWLLAVPQKFGSTGCVSSTIARCASCGEPRSAHPGTQYSNRDISSEYDVAKAKNWVSSELGWNRWLDRDVILSVRLYRLLKRIGGKGLYEATCQSETSPDPKDLEWIDQALDRLAQYGVSIDPPGVLSKDDARWFRNYLKIQKTDSYEFDFKSYEKQARVKLPKSYKDYVTWIGGKTYVNVDDEEGNVVRVLKPEEIDLVNYRLGAFETTDEDSEKVDGIMFAESEHGDCYCFDLAAGLKEPPVVLYRHEGLFYEPYTDNFVKFIQRLTNSNG